MDINALMCHHLPVGWGRVSVHPAVFGCPGSMLPTSAWCITFPLGRGSAPAAALEQRAGRRLLAWLPASEAGVGTRSRLCPAEPGKQVQG